MKAVALFSGGLDSTLAVKLLIDEGIEVVALNCYSPFCRCVGKTGCRKAISDATDRFDIELRTAHLGEDYLEILRSPRFGYGKNLNPCIDCRILMLRRAREIMEAEDASFIITGEVLGQRPKSQHRQALQLIERESGLEGLILRPLSAKFLPPTLPEQKGWIRRESLLGFSGRTRRPQMKLAGELGIKDYPCPAGGCLLTDPGFCRRLRDLMQYGQLTLTEIELLKIGRHFRITPDFKLVVGRNETENSQLSFFRFDASLILEPAELKGPLVVGKGSHDEKSRHLAARITARYTDADARQVAISLLAASERRVVSVAPMSEEDLDRLRL